MTGNLPQEIVEQTSPNCDKYEGLESKFKVKESQRGFYGYLYLTTYKLKFIQDNQKSHLDTGFFTIPFGYILKVNESVANLEKATYLTIVLKDDRTFKFKFEVLHQFKSTLKAIRERSFTDRYLGFPCWKLAPKLRQDKVKLISHWDIQQTVIRDFKRLGISTN